MQDAEKKCKGTETLIYRDNETFIQTEQAHDTDRGNLEFKLSGLEKQIPQLNKQVSRIAYARSMLHELIHPSKYILKITLTIISSLESLVKHLRWVVIKSSLNTEAVRLLD